MTKQIFLIGGGWRAAHFSQTYGRFLDAAAARRGGERRIAVVVAEEEGADPHAQFRRFFEAFEAVGLKKNEAFETIVSAENPLTLAMLKETKPTGVFVCGGLTPAYADALCLDKDWLAYLDAGEIPYGGFSAGASVAAARAIVGGWRRKIGAEIFEIANENAGEDLDLLEVRDGLGLVPFAVDVHATQWGTLSRLVHAVDAGSADEGFAIDENTLLEIAENGISVFGAGNAYRVRRAENNSLIDIFRAGNHISAS